MHAFTSMKAFSYGRGHFRFQRALPLADLTRFANWKPHKHRKPGPSLHNERNKKGLGLPPLLHTHACPHRPHTRKRPLPRARTHIHTYILAARTNHLHSGPGARAGEADVCTLRPHQPYRHHCLLQVLSIPNGHAHVGLVCQYWWSWVWHAGRAAENYANAR